FLRQLLDEVACLERLLLDYVVALEHRLISHWQLPDKSPASLTHHKLAASRSRSPLTPAIPIASRRASSQIGSAPRLRWRKIWAVQTTAGSMVRLAPPRMLYIRTSSPVRWSVS